jgi:hypothetical protein
MLRDNLPPMEVMLGISGVWSAENSVSRVVPILVVDF